MQGGIERVRKIRGKIKNVGAPTFLGGGTPPRFFRKQGEQVTNEAGVGFQGE
jgi:hypothetical protein